MVDILYESLPLTDRQREKLQDIEQPQTLRDGLLNTLKDHHDSERAFMKLTEALREDKHETLANQIVQHRTHNKCMLLTP